MSRYTITSATAAICKVSMVAALQDKLLTARENAVEAAKQTVMLEAAQADKDRLEREKAALEAELATARRPWWQKILVKK